MTLSQKYHHYYVFNKPFGTLSQFTDVEGRNTLSDYGPFPKDVYPVGRLDYDSEGLLLLTNDNLLKHQLIDPKNHRPRTYLVQVERTPSEESISKLREGLIIEKRKTYPAEVRLLDVEPDFPPRSVPIRFRKNVGTAWLEIVLREGRNRQVRKMTAAIGHPTLRLIRIKIGCLNLKDLKPGEFRELKIAEVNSLKKSFTHETQR
ncbi:MAG: pseudouridine synthase [Ignavibacteriales bacterium]|nr:pseudouridine synthase [Ignavibacteriales bacterium]